MEAQELRGRLPVNAARVRNGAGPMQDRRRKPRQQVKVELRKELDSGCPIDYIIK